MSSYNHVSLMGHLTRNVKLTEFDNGGCVANFSIALNEVWNDRDGERQEDVTFIDITAWNRQAEIAHEYLKKGSPILVHGSIKMDEWENDEGEKRQKLFIRAQRLIFVGKRDDNDNDDNDSQDSDNSRTSSKSSGRSSESNKSNRNRNSAKTSKPSSTTDDGIPF